MYNSFRSARRIHSESVSNSISRSIPARVRAALRLDGCARWQSLLTRRADGKIAATQWGLLQDHLANCSRCQTAAQADDALHTVLGLREHTYTTDTAHAFDERVLSTLSLAPRPRPAFAGLRTRISKAANVHRQAISFDFVAQLGGGAVAAAGLTCFVLISALHSQSSRSLTGASADRLARQSLQRSALPVPLEALLNNPSPRAAMLWTTPARTSASRAHKPVYSPSAPPSDNPSRSRPAADLLPPVGSRPESARPAHTQHSARPTREAFG